MLWYFSSYPFFPWNSPRIPPQQSRWIRIRPRKCGPGLDCTSFLHGVFNSSHWWFKQNKGMGRFGNWAMNKLQQTRFVNHWAGVKIKTPLDWTSQGVIPITVSILLLMSLLASLSAKQWNLDPQVVKSLQYFNIEHIWTYDCIIKSHVQKLSISTPCLNMFASFHTRSTHPIPSFSGQKIPARSNCSKRHWTRFWSIPMWKSWCQPKIFINPIRPNGCF